MITEVVAALIWDGGRFLICKRPPDKARGLLYEFVGGKVEPGETKEEALIRECREELGITITVGTQFCAVMLSPAPKITILFIYNNVPLFSNRLIYLLAAHIF